MHDLLRELQEPSWASEEPGKTVYKLMTSTTTEITDVVPKDLLQNPYGKAFLDNLGSAPCS